MVKQNDKVCQAQNLGSHDRGQGHNHKFVFYKSYIHNDSKKGLTNLIKFWVR